jgi:hypothetical protein
MKQEEEKVREKEREKINENQKQDKEYECSKNKLFEFLSLISSLLASNCCVIQLILNIFSLGCAGFAIFEKFEIQFHLLTFIFISLLLSRKGIKSTYLVIIFCIFLSFSKIFLNLFFKENTINSNIFVRIKGVKCNGCAIKLCSELKSIVKKCSIENLKPPFADLILEADENIKENEIRNKINIISFDYKILEMDFLQQN